MSSPNRQVHAGSILGGPKIIHYVRPTYPAWARKKRIQGAVEFRAVIGKDGSIQNLTLIRGPKPLVPYAEAAVRQWKYEPPKLNGVPVQVITEIILDFTLSS